MNVVHFLCFLAFLAIASSAIMRGTKTAALQKQLSGWGDLRGMTEAHIVATVGKPNGRLAIAVKQELLQWTQPGYHIALLFTGNVADGASHEHAG